VKVDLPAGASLTGKYPIALLDADGARPASPKPGAAVAYGPLP
jgi:hypothetical protein